MANEPITREEMLLNAVATGEAANLEPITREEMFLAKLGGADVNTPTPITRKEQFLQLAIEGGGSGGGTIEPLSVTENGTYTAPEGVDGYSPVTVAVAPPASDIDALIEGSLTEITSGVEKVGDYALNYKENLTSASFPNATSIGFRALEGCSKLTTVYLPNVENLGASSFNRCSKLTTVYSLSITLVGDNAFRSCYILPTANLSNATAIRPTAFYGCYSLTAVILRSESVCVLSSTNVFEGCYHIHGTVNSTYNPDGLKDGYIYVPAALVEDYKVATNWATIATQFRALEDWTVDGTTTGELDWDKINGGAE